MKLRGVVISSERAKLWASWYASWYLFSFGLDDDVGRPMHVWAYQRSPARNVGGKGCRCVWSFSGSQSFSLSIRSRLPFDDDDA